MKKLIVTAMMTALSIGAFAQGTIIFQNSSTQLVMDQQTGAAAAVGTHVAFYYSPTSVTDPLSSSLNLISGGTGTLISAGRFILGTKTTGTDAAAGATIYASVRAWTGSYTDWASAYAAALAGQPVEIGTSPVFAMGTGGVGQPPTPPVALSTITAFTGLTVAPVPEPTTFALAGLGAAALLIFRRRS